MILRECWQGCGRPWRRATGRVWPRSLRKGRRVVTLWEVDVHPAAGQPDLLARSVVASAADLGLPTFSIAAARGFLVQGQISRDQIARLSRELLADLVVETSVVGRPGDSALTALPLPLGEGRGEG